MSIKDKLISNATYLSLNWFFNTLFFMLFWILLGKTLLPGSYGKVALALQVATLLSSFGTFGLASTINKLVPELVERKQQDKIQGLLSFSLKITLVASVCLSVGLIAVSMLTNFLNPDVILLIIITVFLMAVATILSSVYYGLQNMKKVFLTNLYGWITMMVLVVAFLALDHYMSFGIGYLGPIIAMSASFLVMVLTRVEKNMFNFSKKIIIDKKTIFKYSIPAFVVIIFSSILNNSQFIILSSMKTFEEIGVFAVAMKIISVVAIIPTTLSGALFPITSGLSVDENSKSKQSYLISLLFRYTVFLVVPIALFVIIFSKYLILFFSSAEYLGATEFLPILVVGGLVLGLAQQFRQSLYAIGKPKRFRDSYIASAATYLILSIPLTYYFSAVGLAIAYLVSSLVLFITALVFIKKTITLKLPMKEMGKIFFGVFVSFLFLFFVKPFIPNILIAIPFVLVALLLYFVILLKLKFYIEEDLKFLDVVIKRTPFFKSQLNWFREYLSKHVTKSYRDFEW